MVAGWSAGSCGARQRSRGRLRNLLLDIDLKRFNIGILPPAAGFPTTKFKE
jgi:hypothetical protein